MYSELSLRMFWIVSIVGRRGLPLEIKIKRKLVLETVLLFRLEISRISTNLQKKIFFMEPPKIEYFRTYFFKRIFLIY